MADAPPPPAPPPPPPPAASPAAPSGGNKGLLSAIEGFSKNNLKKAETNVKETSGNTGSPSTSHSTSSAGPGAAPISGPGLGFGDIFKGGAVKLKHVGTGPTVHKVGPGANQVTPQNSQRGAPVVANISLNPRTSGKIAKGAVGSGASKTVVHTGSSPVASTSSPTAIPPKNLVDEDLKKQKEKEKNEEAEQERLEKQKADNERKEREAKERKEKEEEERIRREAEQAALEKDRKDKEQKEKEKADKEKEDKAKVETEKHKSPHHHHATHHAPASPAKAAPPAAAVADDDPGSCAKCHKPLGDQILILPGGTEEYHPACFVCERCSAGLGTTFFYIENQKVCENCAKNPSRAAAGGASSVSTSSPAGDRCVKCQQLLGGGMYVTVEEGNVHIHCLYCDSCHSPLAKLGDDQIEYTKLEEKRLCASCVTKHVAAQEAAAVECFNCKKTIQGNFLTVLGQCFHPDCVCCAFCGSKVEKGKMYNKNDKIACEKCVQ